MSVLLVAYDIADDGRRARVMKALGRLGRRVQYSVFLLQRSTVEEVAAEMREVIDAAEDNVRIHVLCATCDQKAVVLGVVAGEDAKAAFRVI